MDRTNYHTNWLLLKQCKHLYRFGLLAIDGALRQWPTLMRLAILHRLWFEDVQAVVLSMFQDDWSRI